MSSSAGGGGGNSGGGGDSFASARQAMTSNAAYSAPSKTSAPTNTSNANDGGSDNNYQDRIQRISTGVEPGYTPTSSQPFGLTSTDLEEGMNTAIDADFIPTPAKKTLGDRVIDYVKGGGLLGMALRGVAGILAPQENQYIGITGEDGYGEGDFSYSSIEDYALGELGKDYSSLDLEDQAQIDKDYFDRGQRTEAFKDLYERGDTSNLSQLSTPEREAVSNLVPDLAYGLSGQTPQESVAQQFFNNMNMTQGSPLSSDLQTSYNNAKTKVDSILGIIPPSQQFGYSAQPYGLLSSTNMADNPFNIDYLKQRGLI